MRKLSEGELLSLTGLLSMERDALAVSRVMKSLITIVLINLKLQ
jgi:hypothetical protein